MTERTPLQEALEALRPFAEELRDFEGIDHGVSDLTPVTNYRPINIRIGDLRRAAAAFNSLSTHLKGEGDG